MLNYYFLKSSHVKVLRRVGGTDKRTSWLVDIEEYA
jgi:hypothetical protein